MEDTHIVDLYWARSETAIAETSAKYGSYCYSIAYNILANAEVVNNIHLWLPVFIKNGFTAACPILAGAAFGNARFAPHLRSSFLCIFTMYGILSVCIKIVYHAKCTLSIDMLDCSSVPFQMVHY